MVIMIRYQLIYVLELYKLREQVEIINFFIELIVVVSFWLTDIPLVNLRVFNTNPASTELNKCDSMIMNGIFFFHKQLDKKFKLDYV